VQWFVDKPAQAVDTWVGELYRVCGLAWLMVTARASAWFDGRVIDGVVDGFARSVRGAGDRLRHLQSRQLQLNILGAVAVLVLLLLVYLLTSM
jgi:multicomponent Na+:H+ antiporter subunit D